jgi:glycosyltransferase involved in cell wall biosynthesis
MLNLDFKDKYDIVHLTPEIGKMVVGGICTFMNEMYKHHDENVGFIQICSGPAQYIDANLYNEVNKDLLVLGIDEVRILEEINAKTYVIHFYMFAPFITDTIIRDKNIVFVIHSIPTTEPFNPNQINPYENDMTKTYFEYLCGVSDKLVCVSQAEKDKLFILYPACENKTVVIHNGINMDNLYRNDNYKNSRKTFGYIGRIDERKGVYDMIRYITKFDVKLKIATGQPRQAELQRIIQYLRNTETFDKVDFLGWCSGERKNEFFKSIDALIIPSLYEPFGYIALEAMKYGVPVISSYNGGLIEILGEDYRYLYNPYDRHSFNEALLRFINDDNDIVEKELNSIIDRLQNFNVNNMVNNYNQLLNNLH